jgi:carboxypeptidase Q
MPKLLNPWQSSVVSGLRAAVLLCICQHAAVESSGQFTGTMGTAFDAEARAGAMGYPWLEWSTTHIGHRLTGSAGGKRAEQVTDSLFRTIPADTVYRHPFAAQAWSRGSVSLSLGSQGRFRQVDAVSLANTPLAVNITGTVVDAGNGLPADLDRIGARLKGAVALVNIGLQDAPEGTRNLHRSEKTALAIERGVTGIIFVNQATGHVLLTGTASIDGSLITVPAVCISAEEGAALRGTLGSGDAVSVRLAMENRSTMVEAANVVAEIRGSRWPEEVVLIGGHLDSWDLATGATDNGLGAFSIIDIARALVHSGYKPQRTLRFVLFMGEEQGLLGSRALVAHYRDTGELERIRCMINLDMSGNPRGFGVAAPKEWSTLLATINEHIRSTLSAHGTSFTGQVSEEIWLHSDHQPFLLAGVPVLYPLSELEKHVYGCYHSSCDDIHLVDPQAMVNNVRTVGLLAMALGEMPALPAGCTPEELRQRLVDAGLEEPLRIGGDWPW